MARFLVKQGPTPNSFPTLLCTPSDKSKSIEGYVEMAPVQFQAHTDARG